MAKEFAVAINSGSGEPVGEDDAFYLQTCLRSVDIGLYWVRISFTWP